MNDLEKARLMDTIDSLAKKERFACTDIEYIKVLSKHSDSEIRFLCAELMIKCPPKHVEEALVNLLYDDDYLVRVNVCDTLSESDSQKVLQLLCRVAKKDKYGLVRCYAILSLGDIATRNIQFKKDTVEYLKDRESKEKVKIVQLAIFRSLYLLGEVSSLKRLIEGIDSKTYQHRCFAISSLHDILDMNNAEDIKKSLLKRKKSETSYACIDMINEVLCGEKMKRYG